MTRRLWTVVVENADEGTAEMVWTREKDAAWDFKNVRDSAPYIVRAELIDPDGITIAQFDRREKRS